MANIITRETGWSPMPADDLAKAYSELTTMLSLLNEKSGIRHKPPQNDLTHAENFGKYVRELYAVYHAILEEMKSSREWVALQVRSTYHSKADYSDAIVIGSENDPDQVQVRGFHFDPQVFNFPWEDNTMEHPWTPWKWRIGILPEDLDETHYFFDRRSDKIFSGKGSKILFYKMKPKFSANLSLFHQL